MQQDGIRSESNPNPNTISFFLGCLEISLLFSSSVCKFASKSVAKDVRNIDQKEAPGLIPVSRIQNAESAFGGTMGNGVRKGTEKHLILLCSHEPWSLI